TTRRLRRAPGARASKASLRRSRRDDARLTPHVERGERCARRDAGPCPAGQAPDSDDDQRDRAQADRVTDRDRAHDTRECVAQVHHHGSSVSSLNVAKPPPSTRIETAGASSWTSALAPAT